MLVRILKQTEQCFDCTLEPQCLYFFLGNKLTNGLLMLSCKEEKTVTQFLKNIYILQSFRLFGKAIFRFRENI